MSTSFRLLLVAALSALCSAGFGAKHGGGILKPEGGKKMGGFSDAADLSDAEIVAAAQRAALDYSLRRSASSTLFRLHALRRAQQQVVAGVRYKLELDVVATACGRASSAANSAAALHAPGACPPLPGAAPLALTETAVITHVAWLAGKTGEWSDVEWIEA